MAAIAAFFAGVFQELAASTIAAAARGVGIRLWLRFRGRAGPASRKPGNDSSPVAGGASDVSTGHDGGAGHRGAADPDQLRDSTVFFSQRFAAAFPGCRGLCEFDNPREALHRLDVLLQDPISVKTRGATLTPVWWFRGSSALPVTSYKRERILSFGRLNFYFSETEYYRMRRVVAVNRGSYFRNFVYVEVDPMPPTGLYPVDVARSIERLGCAREEYGEYGRLWKRHVTREEYDDGATTVNGRVKDLAGKVKLRIRMLSWYNFILAPHFSPINSRDAEDMIENLLDSILKGQTTVHDLADLTLRLPRHGRDD